MLKKILSLLAISSAAVAAQPVDPINGSLDSTKVFPYLVPTEYLQHHGDAPAWPLGHKIYIVLVLDLGSAVRNVTKEDLEQLRLTPDDARQLAVGNLDKLLARGAIGMRMFTGPQGKPFILLGGHWAAASSILVPTFLQSAPKNLGSDEVCISIPNRDALLIFPKSDETYRDEMLAVIRKNESDNPKLLTFGLFEYGSLGLRALE
jgi:uncharacterized protein YtpQ (UPF0354 family)